jgi:hypothetical protein
VDQCVGRQALLAGDRHDLAVTFQFRRKRFLSEAGNLARWEALQGTCWSVPVLANGKLYVRNESRLIALDLVSEPSE